MEKKLKRKLIGLPEDVWNKYKQLAKQNYMTTAGYIRSILIKRLEEN